MPDDLPLPPLGPVLDWPKVARPRPEDSPQFLLDSARRRLHTDPLFSARVRLALRVLDVVAERGLPLPAVRIHASEAAALALLVAERPELITGERPRRRPPADVLAWVVAPVISYSGLSAADVAAKLLQALELDGYEVTVRADRFASLDHPGTTPVRIPLRGRCGICRGPVERTVDGTTTELLVGPWRHPGQVDGDGHAPAGVEPV